MAIVVHVSSSPFSILHTFPFSDSSTLYCDLGDVPKCITYPSEGFNEFWCITDVFKVFTKVLFEYSEVLYLYA
jgi:hypothetical protein